MEINVHIDLSRLERYRARWHDTTGPIMDMRLQWAARYRSWAQLRFDSASKGDGTWPPLAVSTIRARTQAPVARLGLALALGSITAHEYAERLPKAQAKARAATKRFGKKVKDVTGQSGDPYQVYKKATAETQLEVLSGSISILRDTGTLFRVLDPVFQNQPGALQEMVEDGIIIGFGGPATYADGGLASIADIASFHQHGGPHLPKREIIVQPPQDVIDGMVQDAERAAKKLAHETKGV